MEKNGEAAEDTTNVLFEKLIAKKKKTASLV